MSAPGNLRVGLALVAGLGASTVVAVAQQQPQPLIVQQLKPDVYWTQGGAGGNTGIIVGKTGVIVIDAKTTPDSAKEMLTQVAKITSKPITKAALGDQPGGGATFIDVAYSELTKK